MSSQDPATQYILARISDLSGRIEDALRMLERRTEQTAVMREQLSDAQKDILEIFRIIRGDGVDRPGLQTHYHDVIRRLDSVESALDELDGTARLNRVEIAIEQIKESLTKSERLAVQDRKGEWALKVESRKGKLLLLAAVVAAILGWGQNIWHFLQSFIK